MLERIGEVGGEVQAAAVALDQLGEPRLPDRDAALVQALDLGLVDVDAVDVGAELGESGRGDQADVARADDADRLPFVHAHQAVHPSERCEASYFWPRRRSDAAIAIIWRVLFD